MMKIKLLLIFALTSLVWTGAYAQNKSWEKIPPMPKLLSQREQLEVRSQWLAKRFDMLLLPMMKKANVDMWIVVNEEFHTDPVTPQIVPPIPIVGRRDFFIFSARGGKLERIAVVRYEEEQLKSFYTLLTPPREGIAETIKKLVAERDPKTIAINYKGTRGASSGLTGTLTNFWLTLSAKSMKSVLCRPSR
jgi:Xaa-Pro dipeptidase